MYKIVYTPAIDDLPEQGDIFSIIIIDKSGEKENDKRDSILKELNNAIRQYMCGNSSIAKGADYIRHGRERSTHYHPFHVITPDKYIYPMNRQFQIRITYTPDRKSVV